ncbi:transcription factor E4F1-like [Thrips palmi]|uniref:Transcription factor E4F1-like n=1 Tax=Thrips palmi TaxID=161013 RepID=A0A6P8Y2E5_THRPL|nr:transcription factor E4F1-like [Thrips palmi]
MLEFPQLCRLCASKTENGLYIYCDEGKRRQVETKIRLYLHFQVLPSDSLPKKICASCFEELEGMHRFAINALKVQDNLSRLAKELPMTAIDVCKTFMTSYVHEPVVINDTIASLTSQEVTEMEVQVDPMIFLEDDQSEDAAQDTQIDAGMEAVQSDNDLQTLPQNVENNYFGNKDNLTVPEDNLKSSESTEEKDNTWHSEHSPPNNFKEIIKQKSGEDVDKLESICEPSEEPQYSATEKRSQEEPSAQNGNRADLCNKETTSIQEDFSSEMNVEKKAKKASSVSKCAKKPERSALTESIKYTTYTCPICKKVFMKRGLFKGHLETHKTDLKFACEICLRVFKKEVNLIRHRKSHSELTIFPCAHCNRVYPTKSTLRSHLVSHSDERPHVCNICSKSFKRNQDLKFHLNQHNGLRPYHCPYCTKAFASSGNCFSHRRRAHMQEIERDRALRKNSLPSD